MFTVSARVINVPGDYPTIQQAIDVASSGDTIQVAPGIYYEQLTITKSLTLIGQNKTTTIIDGKGIDNVVNVKAGSVKITGFTIRNGGRLYSGIKASGYSGITVANNIISSNVFGINIVDSLGNNISGNTFFDNSKCGIILSYSASNTIASNNMSESAYGIQLYVSNTTFVVGNTLSANSYSIYVYYSTNNTVSGNRASGKTAAILIAYSDKTVVSDNVVSDSAYGIQLYGLQSKSNSVTKNTLSDNSYGIYMAHVYSGNNMISDNTVSKNDWGITMYNSTVNTFVRNTVSNNTYGISPVSYSRYNTIYHNNFIDNVEQVQRDPTSPNTWDNGKEGNYWSDYEGVDDGSGGRVAGDGVGDTLIPHLGVDYYPLMNPWGGCDAAIISVTSSTTRVYVGQVVGITVVAKNEGAIVLTFNVTAKYDNTVIGTQTVTNLAPGAQTTLTFNWNTTGATPCTTYTIKAEASVTPGELDTADNTRIDGTVKIKLVGDVNGDGIVNISDLSIVAWSFTAEPGDPTWNPDADINGDNYIDVVDLTLVAIHYMEKC